MYTNPNKFKTFFELAPNKRGSFLEEYVNKIDGLEDVFDILSLTRYYRIYTESFDAATSLISHCPYQILKAAVMKLIEMWNDKDIDSIQLELMIKSIDLSSLTSENKIELVRLLYDDCFCLKRDSYEEMVNLLLNLF